MSFPGDLPRADKGRFPFDEAARQALIEHRRLMKAQRQFAAVHREAIDAEWNALPDGRARNVITPAIKARADAEWNAMDERGRLPKGWTWEGEGR